MKNTIVIVAVILVLATAVSAVKLSDKSKLLTPEQEMRLKEISERVESEYNTKIEIHTEPKEKKAGVLTLVYTTESFLEIHDGTDVELTNGDLPEAYTFMKDNPHKSLEFGLFVYTQKSLGTWDKESIPDTTIKPAPVTTSTTTLKPTTTSSTTTTSLKIIDNSDDHNVNAVETITTTLNPTTTLKKTGRTWNPSDTSMSKITSGGVIEIEGSSEYSISKLIEDYLIYIIISAIALFVGTLWILGSDEE